MGASPPVLRDASTQVSEADMEMAEGLDRGSRGSSASVGGVGQQLAGSKTLAGTGELSDLLGEPLCWEEDGVWYIQSLSP